MPALPPLGDRARSFGALAQAYHEHRPGYPDSAVDWALAPALVTVPGGPLEVLDLAAGTGKLTASLVRRPRTAVTAVEPDPEMLEVLRAGLPTVTALAGTAEDIPLPAGSVHAVLVGQAFHWFDVEAATAEIVRVLRPGGSVGLLWNREDRDVEWIREYYEIAGWSQRAGRARHDPSLPAGTALTDISTTSFANPVRTTVEGLLRTLGTYSWISTLNDTDRRATMEKARAYLAARPEVAPQGADFELPLRTTVLRASRPDIVRR